MEAANKIADVKKVYVTTSWLNDWLSHVNPLVQFLEKWPDLDLHLFCHEIFLNSPAGVNSLAIYMSNKPIDEESRDLWGTMEYRGRSPMLLNLDKKLEGKGCAITFDHKFSGKDWPREECEVWRLEKVLIGILRSPERYWND